jgi:hypothetical protein
LKSKLKVSGVCRAAVSLDWKSCSWRLPLMSVKAISVPKRHGGRRGGAGAVWADAVAAIARSVSARQPRMSGRR